MNKHRICFLVGSVAISGGTYVIIQHASYLQRQGYFITLAVLEGFDYNALSWHDSASSLRCLHLEDAKAESFDLVIATWWKTVFELHQFKALRYAYFVQSVESRFYPETEVALRALVESTYGIPVAYVTEASWIRRYLMEKYGHDATLVRNGIRKDIYKKTGDVISRRNLYRMPRVLIEGHFGVPFKNTALGVRLAREAGAQEIWVLTGTPVNWLPGVSRVFSRVPMVKTPLIYRSCDVLVKLSTVEGMFGPPLEMFHCGGTALVFDVSGHDEYIVHKENAIVVPTGDMEGVVTNLRRLLNDRLELLRLQNGAQITADGWMSWESASEKFHIWIKSVLISSVSNGEVIGRITNEAFDHYARSEHQRTSKNSSALTMSVRTLSRNFSILKPIKLVLKRLEAIFEILFGTRRVY